MTRKDGAEQRGRAEGTQQRDGAQHCRDGYERRTNRGRKSKPWTQFGNRLIIEIMKSLHFKPLTFHREIHHVLRTPERLTPMTPNFRAVASFDVPRKQSN